MRQEIEQELLGWDVLNQNNSDVCQANPRVISAISCEPKVAYFSMEVGIDPEIPTYSGGLGILAGDTIRSCADLKIPLVGVTLLYEHGYFNQKIDENGNQVEEAAQFVPADHMSLIASEIQIEIGDRSVFIRPWYYPVRGNTGFEVPVIFLDSNIKENDDWSRNLTKCLYGGDQQYRLAQEIILGIGGVKMLRELGLTGIFKFHMNEGHASLLTLELYDKTKNAEYVRQQCVFTTHTPVTAGHDQFELSMAKSMLGDMLPDDLIPEITFENKLNMTKLGLFFSRFINGVAKSHKETSEEMFPGYSIDSITNGVHSPTWTSEPFKKLFDKYIPEWRLDASVLRSAFSIPGDSIWSAHMDAKKLLIDHANRETGSGLDLETFTIGFARRQTEYKRPGLLVSDSSRLMEVAESAGPLQIIYAGKAHPIDLQGKELIRQIMDVKKLLGDKIKVAFLRNYDMGLAKMIIAGVDLWLNTPRCPMEASGTSGMKAAHNGVPQFSTLDGWWIEGYIEDITGWSIGTSKIHGNSSDDRTDRDELYDKLEKKIIPMFYKDRERWIRIMRNCIAVNASYFHTQRMVEQYVVHAYFL